MVVADQNAVEYQLMLLQISQNRRRITGVYHRYARLPRPLQQPDVVVVKRWNSGNMQHRDSSRDDVRGGSAGYVRGDSLTQVRKP